MKKHFVKKNQLLNLLLLLIVITSWGQKKHTTFTPGEIWKDTDGKHINAHGGGITIVGKTYYWFGEHKVEGERGNQSWVGVGVYSSKDLYNWKNEGIALPMKKDTNSMFVEGSVVERPKVIFNKKTGKYVMWFHHELKGKGYDAALIGVAVSKKITGPYEYITSFRINPGILPQNLDAEKLKSISLITDRQDPDRKEKVKEGAFIKRDLESGQMSRDMTLYVDDDGTAYHITASEENETLLISKLSDDYLSLNGEYVRVFPGGRNEAPAIFKQNNKYYMITSGLTGWNPNPARSAVADSMFGPWKSLGNPVRGNDKEKATTFHSQSTYIFPVIGKKDTFIFMADRWNPKNAIDGRYIWLPIEFENENPVIKWYPTWDLSFFKTKKDNK